jgi:chaperonin GroES
MKFIPLYERVLVSVLEGKKEMAGFVLPDNARDDYLMGSVITTGEGYRKETGEIVPLTIKPGMVVMFGPYAGTKVQINGDPFLSMREGEILGWLETSGDPEIG